MTNSYFNIEHLLELTNNDINFVKELAGVFCETIPPMADEMQIACDESNWQAVSQLAHKLKPSIDTMRIESIRDDILQIESRTKQNIELHTVPALVTKVCEVVYLTRDELMASFLK
ncbi:hypothetical protein QTN47_08330 [Danxiaibacter flavus]|uniref:HPt domain-containing protein n=1 Tax=Danxiaibacter flavus TaxID=3049108 RepID=A0ABV3ZCC3_9BACT|nr:hypothetical protein QNM32_08330 [Chitinophagaceae bacterium DXS]